MAWRNRLRGAAVSVASNIAEGNGHCTDKEFLLFLHHARGSIFEVETQLTITGGLYIARSQVERMSGSAGEIARMLYGLIKAIKCDVGDLREDKKRIA